MPYLAPDVFEVDVNPFGTLLLQGAREILRVPIDGCVEPECGNQVLAFVRASRDSYRARLCQLRELTDQRPNGTRCRGNEECLAVPGLTDEFHSDIRSEARHAQYTKVCGYRYGGSLYSTSILRVDGGMSTPPNHRAHEVALPIACSARLNHFGHYLPFHRVPNRYRLGIRRRNTHAPAPIRV